MSAIDPDLQMDFTTVGRTPRLSGWRFQHPQMKSPSEGRISLKGKDVPWSPRVCWFCYLVLRWISEDKPQPLRGPDATSLHDLVSRCRGNDSNWISRLFGFTSATLKIAHNSVLRCVVDQEGDWRNETEEITVSLNLPKMCIHVRLDNHDLSDNIALGRLAAQIKPSPRKLRANTRRPSVTVMARKPMEGIVSAASASQIQRHPLALAFHDFSYLNLANWTDPSVPTASEFDDRVQSVLYHLALLALPFQCIHVPHSHFLLQPNDGTQLLVDRLLRHPQWRTLVLDGWVSTAESVNTADTHKRFCGWSETLQQANRHAPKDLIDPALVSDALEGVVVRRIQSNARDEGHKLTMDFGRHLLQYEKREPRIGAFVKGLEEIEEARHPDRGCWFERTCCYVYDARQIISLDSIGEYLDIYGHGGEASDPQRVFVPDADLSRGASLHPEVQIDRHLRRPAPLKLILNTAAAEL
ncbi:MAG: hypothetical protein WCI73_00090, partial [Phycisphaerae bacterium]